MSVQGLGAVFSVPVGRADARAASPETIKRNFEHE
jgi:hypothetical protein